MWTKKCTICIFDFVDRLWHAGLSTDGGNCFLSSVDEEYFVASTDHGQVIWTGNEYESDELWPLEDAITDGHIEFAIGSVAERYRIFGLHHNFAITKAEKLGIELQLASATLQIRDMDSQQILQELEFSAFSGDWAYASFSDDYSTIAVLEPYYITVFRR